jgi:hypothetical protein
VPLEEDVLGFSSSRRKKHHYFEKKNDDSTLLGMLAERGFTGLTIADPGNLNPPDEFETELRIMTEVRGYFQVAYKVRIGFASTLYQVNNGTNAHWRHFLENR